MNTSRSTSAEFDRTLNQTYNAVLNYDYQITKDHYLAAMLGLNTTMLIKKDLTLLDRVLRLTILVIFNLQVMKKENVILIHGIVANALCLSLGV
ncbi:hypothetical protein NXV59_21750 [Bacteroides fragilis]|nr:hypothetical protein [Bacteroides fragilis]